MKEARSCSAILLLCLALAACGKNKIEQCNAFIDRATKAQTVINALNLASEDQKELEKDAATIDAEAKGFGSFEVHDEKLIGFRAAYAGTLSEMGKIMANLAAAQAQASDPAQSEAAATKIKALVQQAEALEKSESTLVDQINLYCTGTQ